MKNKILSLLLSLCLILGMLPAIAGVAAASGTVSDFEGQGFTVSTSGTYPWTVEDKDGSDVLTAHSETSERHVFTTMEIAFSESGVFNFDYSTETTEGNGTLYYSFVTFTSSEYTSKPVNGNQVSEFSGSHDWRQISVNVTAGDTLYFVYANKRNDTGYVWLRNLSLSTGGFSVVVRSSDESLGTVSASADSVEADASDNHVTLTASAINGGRFYGWTENGRFLSAESEYTIEVQSDRDITAYFGSETQYKARVDGVFYDDVASALAAADGGTASTPAYVVLTNDAELSSNVELNPYTVFVLPYSDLDSTVQMDADTSDRPFSNGAEASPASTVLTGQGEDVTYTLTIGNGASLTVPATAVLAVGGMYSGKQPIGGQVCGAHSEIDVEGTLNVDGGILSCCGYIYGGGEMNVTGGTVYENFTVTDFNGGGIFVEDASKGMFPFETYTVMGIQCQTTFDASSFLKAYCALYVSSSIMQIPVEVVGGSEALIQINSGYAVMSYDESKTFTVTTLKGSPIGEIGTLNIKLYGNATVGAMRLSLAGFNFNTQSFECPLPYSITIEQVSGTLDVTARLRILPGSMLKVDEGAVLNIAYGGSLNAEVENATFDFQSNNAYTYPLFNQLDSAGYYPFAEVIVDGTLTVADGAGIGGLIMIGENGTVEVSEYADTSVNPYISSIRPIMTDEEILALEQQLGAAFMAFQSDPSAAETILGNMYSAIAEGGTDIDQGLSYNYDPDSDEIVSTPYDEGETPIDTITFVNYDYLDYIKENGSAEGYVPLATITQERHTALTYPNDIPVGEEDVVYDTNCKRNVFVGWYELITTPLGQLAIKRDGNPLMNDGNEILYTELPEVNGDAIYMAGYEEVWLQKCTVTFVYNNGADNTAYQTVIETDCAIKPEDPTKDGYTFDGWFAPDAATAFDFNTPITADITLTAHWTENVTAALTADNFTDLTVGYATVAVTDGAAGTFTVTCSNACMVFYRDGEGQFQKLEAQPTADANTYSFTAPAGFDASTKIMVAVKGDANGDGSLDAKDATRLQRYIANKSYNDKHPDSPRADSTMDEFQVFFADANGDGSLDAKDATRIQRYIANKSYNDKHPDSPRTDSVIVW